MLSRNEAIPERFVMTRDGVDFWNRARAWRAEEFLYSHMEHEDIARLAKQFKGSRPKVTTQGPRLFKRGWSVSNALPATRSRGDAERERSSRRRSPRTLVLQKLDLGFHGATVREALAAEVARGSRGRLGRRLGAARPRLVLSRAKRSPVAACRLPLDEANVPRADNRRQLAEGPHESGKVRCSRRRRHLRRRIDRPRPAALAAREAHHRPRARHDRRGRRASHAALRAGHGPPDLDGLRRICRPERGDPDPGVESAATRSGARRLRTGVEPRARGLTRARGQDHRSGLGSQRKRRQFRGEQFRRGDPDHARPGKGARETPALDGRAEAGARHGKGGR